jgi:MerR family transcriptional regulator, redox-sensitive transcriptional activator SoxR
MSRLTPQHNQRPLSAGQLAARSAVAVSTIHFYEAKKLIRGWRTSGNQRRYGGDVLRRVAVIKVARRLGLPLDTIRKAMDGLPGGRTPTAADWQRLAAAWHADLQRRIRILQKLSRELGGCIGCGCLSLRICRLRNRADHLAEQGPGPRWLEPAATLREGSGHTLRPKPRRA